jgi:hypothetical protein
MPANLERSGAGVIHEKVVGAEAMRKEVTALK